MPVAADFKVRVEATEFFFDSAPPLFLALQVGLHLVVLVSAFVMVSTVWSVSCLLFFYPCAAICKSGGGEWGTCHPCPVESLPLMDAQNVRNLWGGDF